VVKLHVGQRPRSLNVHLVIELISEIMIKFVSHEIFLLNETVPIELSSNLRQETG
jgi:hypothetical protein